MTKDQATELLLQTLGPKFVVKSVIDYDDKFLFIAHSNDPYEGDLDPFFSVDKRTSKVVDFSPQDYPEPLVVIKKLQAAISN